MDVYLSICFSSIKFHCALDSLQEVLHDLKCVEKSGDLSESLSMGFGMGE